jgi:hypothetical protein
MARKKKKSKPNIMPAERSNVIGTITALEQFTLWKAEERKRQPILVRTKSGVQGGTDKQNNKRDRKKARQEGKNYSRGFSDGSKSNFHPNNEIANFSLSRRSA